MTIILLNGPPDSGKDTAAKFVQRLVKDTKHAKFADPLKSALHALLGLNHNQIKEMLNKKDEVLPWTDPYTPRQLYIKLSEDFLKPLFGEDVLGRIAVRRINQLAARNIVMSDCGFDAEVLPVIRESKKGACCLIELSRQGRSFDNDSRSYLSDSTKQYTGVQHIKNDLDLEMFEAQIKRALKRFGVIEDE